MRAWPLIVVIAACGAEPPTETVTLHAWGNDLLAMRQEGGPWRQLTLDDQGFAIAEVSGPFTVASVCDLDGFFNYYAINATSEDFTVLDVYCVDTGPSQLIAVTNPLASTATMFLGTHEVPPGQTIEIPSGAYDVVALDTSVTPPWIEIRHEVELSQDLSLNYDPQLNGVAMTPATYTVADAGDDTIGAVTRLATKLGTYAHIPAADGAAWVVPTNMIAVDDIQTFRASALTGGAMTRTTSRTLRGDETALAMTLPSGIEGASISHDGATSIAWTARDAWPRRYMYLTSPDRSVLYDTMSLWNHVVQTSTENRLTAVDPTDIPGWDPAWTVDVTDYDWYLNLARIANGGSDTTAWSSWDDVDQKRLQVRPYLAAPR